MREKKGLSNLYDKPKDNVKKCVRFGISVHLEFL